MRYRLSGKLTLALHAASLTLISAAYGDIDGGFWLPVAVYVSGALMLWLMSAPGSKRSFVSRVWGTVHHYRMASRHGVENWGHARRRDWDVYGRSARVFLHVLWIFVAIFFAGAAGLHNPMFWQTLLLAASFALGVEIGFMGFRTGDESQWRRHRRPLPRSDSEI